LGGKLHYGSVLIDLVSEDHAVSKLSSIILTRKKLTSRWDRRTLRRNFYYRM